MTYDSKSKETKKEKRTKELQKFRSTFDALRERLTLEEIAQIAKMHASNLSSYGSGSKDPSTATIEKFYARLKAEIEKTTKTRKTSKTTGYQANQVEEDRGIYKRTKRSEDTIGDLVRLLTNNYNRMWADNEKNSKRLDKVVDSNNKLVDSNNILANTNSQLANNNTQVVANNTRLIDKLFPGIGEAS